MPGHPVLDGLHAAGVGGDVAADGGHLLAGEERVAEAVLFDGLVEVGQGDGRLDGGDEVLAVDLDDPVHPLHREDDAAVDSDGAAGEPGAAAPDSDRDALLVGQFEYFRDLAGILRPDDEVGQEALRPGGLVAGVVLPVFTGEYVAFAHYGGEPRYDAIADGVGSAVSAVVGHPAFLRRWFRQALQPTQHRLPVRALPVYPVARRAFHELLLCPEDVGRDTFGDVLPGDGNERRVALEAEAEGLGVAGKTELVDHLANLVFRPVVADEQGAKAAAGNDAPFHDASIAGEDYPSLGEGRSDQAGVAAVAEKDGIVAHHPQPAGELGDIDIDDEAGFRHRRFPGGRLSVDC